MPAKALSVIVTGDARGFQAAMRQAAASTGAFEAKSKGAAARTAAIGKGISKGVTIPLVAAAGISVKFAADFEQQMSAVSAVAGGGAKAMDALKGAALKAGADTKYSALEAAKAEEELAKGGLTASQITGGALKGALALASAGQLDLADAAAYTANALNLFGKRGDYAGHVADAMATAANATTADVGDFGLALAQGGSVAKSAGLSFDQTMTALEALAKSGIKGSDAGTSLKTSIIHLLKPTDKQANLAKKLGLSFLDAHGKMKPLGAISAMMRDKLGGMTKAQRTATLATLAGTDGVRTLTSLYDAGPKKLGAYEHGLAKQGTAATVAAKKQDNLRGNLEQLKGSLETLAIIIGTTLLPPLTSAAKWLTGFANHVATAFHSLSPSGQTAVLAIAGVVAAIGPIVLITAKMITAFNTVKTALSGLRTAMMAMRVVAATAFGPVGLAIMAVAIAGVLVVTHWKQVKSALTAVWGAIKAAAGAVFAFVGRLAQTGLLGPIPLILSRWKQVKAALAAVWNAIKSAASSAFHAVASVVSSGIGAAVHAVSAAVGAARAAGSAVAHGVVAGIKAIGSAVAAAAGALVKAGIAVVRGYIGVYRTVGGAVARALVAGIRALAGAARGAAQAVAHAVAGAVRGLIGWMAGAGRAAAQGLINGIKALAGAAAAAAANLVKGAINAAKKKLHIGSPSKVFHDIGAQTGQGYVNGVRSMHAATRAAVGELFPNESELARLNTTKDAVQSSFDAADQRRQRDALQAKAGRRIIGTKKSKSRDSDTRQARKDLAEFNREASRAHQLSAIDVRIKGAEQVVAFKNAVQSASSSLHDLAAAQAQANRAVAEKGIDAALKSSLDAIKNSPQAKELGDLLAGQSADQRAREDRDAQAAVDDAKAKLRAVQEGRQATADATLGRAQGRLDDANKALAAAKGSGSATLVANASSAQAIAQRAVDAAASRVKEVKDQAVAAQKDVDDALAAQAEIARQREIDRLSGSIDDQKQAAEDKAQAERDGLDAIEAAQTASFDRQLQALTSHLTGAKGAYAQFVTDVNGLLGNLAVSGADVAALTGDAGAEADLTAAPGVAKKANPRKPKKKAKPKHHAAGGLIRLGDMPAIDELGPEGFARTPSGALRVVGAGQSQQGPDVVIEHLELHGLGGPDEGRALAEQVGFRVATRRR